jgi:Fe-S-cluster-containing dehydrogenase component
MNMQNCYGCQTCEIVCKSKNNLPEGVRWRRVRTFTTETPPSLSSLSMACNHCKKPECMRVCPVNAYSKRADGIVVQNHSRCIGCKKCIKACPYEAPSFDPQEGKTSKCDYCADLVDQGLPPRCVETCPASTSTMEAGELTALQRQYAGDTAIKGIPSAALTGPSVVIKPTKATKL